MAIGVMLFGVFVVLGGNATQHAKSLAMLPPSPLWGIGLVLGVFCLGVWGLPKWQVARIEEPGKRLALESEARKTLTFALGGGLLLIGLYLIWGTLQDMRRMLEHAQYNQQGERQEQIGAQLQRATEQLGAMHAGGQGKNLEIRLSGLYALERITQGFPQTYWSVLEILTAYARANPSTSTLPPVDLEAVITILKRRGKAYGHGEEQPLNLRAVGWRGMSLENIHLARAMLSQADLRGANLAEANLRGANLAEARLSGATLTGTMLAEANLRGADLHDARLHGAILTGANLQGADLSGVDLTQVVLEGASLQGARLHTAILQGMDLRDIPLAGAFMQATDLRHANLAGANLASNILSEATLTGAILTRADLQSANLLRANVQEANLAHANLHGANLQEANLAGASLQQANLRSATLVDVKNLTQEQFNTACTDDRRPKWPFNLTWPGGLQPSSALQETCLRWEIKP
jgi:uncharacterized protein YjbI with pentapeptide repeats